MALHSVLHSYTLSKLNAYIMCSSAIDSTSVSTGAAIPASQKCMNILYDLLSSICGSDSQV